jgi:hypothetical protein
LKVAKRMIAFSKSRFLLILMCLSLILIVYSWFQSYPLLINSPTDFIFNHVSSLYWIGLSFFLGSGFIWIMISKNRSLVLIICLMMFFAIYSLRYFYPTVPGSDANTFRGLVEYAAEFHNLDSLLPHHMYFQWPAFFVFNNLATAFTGLEIVAFEFIFFAILGILYFLSLSSYFSSYSIKSFWIGIFAFIIVMYWFLNYQFAPFSLAMGLLFVLIMIEARNAEKFGALVCKIVLFVSISLIHPFAGVLYVGFLAVMYIRNRRKEYLNLFVLTLIVWLVISIFFTKTFFETSLRQLISLGSVEYQTTVSRTFADRIAPSPPIDMIAQWFSRFVVISTGFIAGLGFVFLGLKRKLRTVDVALFVSAGIYAAAGFFLPVLGTRAWFVLAMPICLGAIYAFKSRLKRLVRVIFFILLILFVFVPISESFIDAEIFYQTEDVRYCMDFAITNFNWTAPISLLAHYRQMNYLQAKSASSASFGSDLSPSFPDYVPSFSVIVYTEGLAKNSFAYNYSIINVTEVQLYNKIYDSEMSCIFIRSNLTSP